MGVVTGIVTYAIILVVVFMAALPVGVRGQWEEGEIAEGTEPGAPVAPMLLNKLKWSAVVTAGIWLVVFAVVQFDLISIDDLPGPDTYWE